MTGAALGFFYLIVTELIDGVAGFLAVLIMIAVPIFRAVSLMLLSQPPMLLLGMLIIWSWLRWRESQAGKWATLIGIAGGCAAITRPLDALCFALPVAAAMLIALRGGGARHAVRTLALIFIGAMPFLALQAVQNVGVTARLSTFPSDLEVSRVYPAPMLGFHKIDWAHIPQPSLLEKRIFNAEVAYPAYRGHQPRRILRDWLDSRLSTTVLATIPALLLVVMLPPALLGILDAGRLVMVSALVLFLIFYTFYVFYFYHYPLVVAPVVCLLIVIGSEQVILTWPRRREFLSAAMFLLIAGLSVVSLPEVQPSIHDEWEAAEVVRADQILSHIADTRALVFVRYEPGCRIIQEPVYNTETAWPDDARVVRVHDRGVVLNNAVYRYYAQRQPDRMAYRYDRRTASLSRLGGVAQLAARP